jgi:N-methylhydantoinase A
VATEEIEAVKLVGCDVGGTFTDLIFVDEAQTRIRVAKVPTTLDNQANGFLGALEAADVELEEVDLIVHGTTTSTNALLERKVARVGLITTAGFRDVLELGRRTRPNPYGMLGSFNPLITREYRLEVSERMDARGQVMTPLDEPGVRNAAIKLREMGCQSLVIHFLHAYQNPEHELRAAQVAASAWPNDHIVTSASVLAEYREFERGVAAAVSASIRPVIDAYLSRLGEQLAARGFRRDLLVMQGNGGTVRAQDAAQAAINTVMSGPASGVIAAAHAARPGGYRNIITYDMGGTSCDVGLVQDGIPQISSERELEYAMPIHVPMVDVHSIGAGGGSIAHLDDSGMLQVGPQSAGATPGPICYGRGGAEPTITDANLLLGRLNPRTLLAVDADLSMRYLRDRISATIGAPLGLTPEQAAAAILQVANHRMAGAVRMVSLARGHDPRDFALFAFGGAGPLHAVALAKELAIPTVLIPARPGITNAIGCVVSDLRHDFTTSVNRALSDLDMNHVHATLAAQIEQGNSALERESVTIEDTLVVHDAEMQFEGQSHMLKVPIATRQITRDALQTAFDKAYFERFALELPQIRAVVVTLHTAVIGRRKPISVADFLDPCARRATLAEASSGRRRIWFESGWRETPIYQREQLPLGACLVGPAVIEQMDTTLVIEPENTAEVDQLGNLVITVPSAWVD